MRRTVLFDRIGQGANRIRFHDRDDAERFLRRVSIDEANMRRMREIHGDAASNQTVIERIARKLENGEVSVYPVQNEIDTEGREDNGQKPEVVDPPKPRPKNLPKPKPPKPSPPPPTPAPVVCATDFKVSDGCKILRKGGDAVEFTASELDGGSGGTFTWSTSSAKLRLTNANSATVQVEGLSTSTSRGSEVITATRSQDGCPDVTKDVSLTVAEVTFRKSNNQRYGFDDFDTPANFDDDHLCVKRSDHTFVRVKIEGGATSDDFTFDTEDAAKASAAAPPGGQTDFDLRINGGASNKAHTKLRAKVKCPSNEIFRQLAVHTYKERLVRVVVGKFYDSTQAGTNLNYATADYADHEATINGKLKEAVVKFDIHNFLANNATSDVTFDLDGNGALSYDINSSGGTEFTEINTAFRGARTTGRVRVAVIREMKSYYYLSVAASIGDTTITVRGSNLFDPGRAMPLGTGADSENVTIASKAGNVATLSAPLTKDHPVGTTLEFPAGGWSSNPILIKEGHASLLTTKWTIAHEAGHDRSGGLELKDVDDATSFMHFTQSWTDYRLRYCPRNKKHEAGTENQWETVPRT